jgi:hypothetical protein
MKNLLRAAAAATILAFAATSANAAAFTGTVSTFGDTTGSGPWNLTSEPTFTYSGIAITATSAITFAQLTDLDATFQDIAGGAYGGSPRFSIGFTSTPNFLHVALGTSPNFNDSNPALFTAAWSGTSVIGASGSRYDLGPFGGSAFTDYNAALALLGNLTISEIDVVLDGGWGANGRQELNLCGVNVNSTAFGDACSTTPVDDVPTLPLMVTGMGLGFFVLRRKRKAAVG